MNQILELKKVRRKNKILLLIQFILFIFILFILIIIYIYQNYSIYKAERLSKATQIGYSIMNLYSNSTNMIVANNSAVSILGTINIPKIDVKYPILSNYSDELLKVSVCKFFGPKINTVGNFCILGHNYNNNYFFSKYYLLKNNDQIIISSFDSKEVIIYSIYTIYEVFPDDISYLSQETSRQKRNYLSYM